MRREEGAVTPKMVHRNASQCDAGAVVGLISSDCRASYRQGDVFLRLKLGGVNGLGIQVKRCGHLGVAAQGNFGCSQSA